MLSNDDKYLYAVDLGIDKIKVYGTEWCGDTHLALLVLNKFEAEFDYIDIDSDAEAAEMVVKLNNGNRSVPTILFPDGDKMVEPSRSTLSTKLRELIAE